MHILNDHNAIGYGDESMMHNLSPAGAGFKMVRDSPLRLRLNSHAIGGGMGGMGVAQVCASAPTPYSTPFTRTMFRHFSGVGLLQKNISEKNVRREFKHYTRRWRGGLSYIYIYIYT